MSLLSKKALTKKAAPPGKTWSPFDEAPVFPEGKPKVDWRPYRCMNCGNEQMFSTNHLGKISGYCDKCSWKPSFGNPEYQVPGPGGRTYRPFEYAGPTERTVMQSHKPQLSKKAGPDTMGQGVSPMGGGGGAGGAGGGGGASPSLLGGAPGPEGLGHWKCQFPDCKRQFGNGQDFRDHLHRDHSVRDVG